MDKELYRICPGVIWWSWSFEEVLRKFIRELRALKRFHVGVEP